MADDVGKVVVDRLVLGRELGEEEVSEVADPLVVVLETLGHLAELSLDLDHAVEDEVGEDHERVLLDGEVLVVKAGVEAVAVLVHDGRKADGNVSESDDDVAPHGGFARRLEDLEEEEKVLLAELGADAHELAEGERGGRLEHRVLREGSRQHSFSDWKRGNARGRPSETQRSSRP